MDSVKEYGESPITTFLRELGTLSDNACKICNGKGLNKDVLVNDIICTCVNRVKLDLAVSNWLNTNCSK